MWRLLWADSWLSYCTLTNRGQCYAAIRSYCIAIQRLVIKIFKTTDTAVLCYAANRNNQWKTCLKTQIIWEVRFSATNYLFWCHPLTEQPASILTNHSFTTHSIWINDSPHEAVATSLSQFPVGEELKKHQSGLMFHKVKASLCNSPL